VTVLNKDKCRVSDGAIYFVINLNYDQNIATLSYFECCFKETAQKLPSVYLYCRCGRSNIQQHPHKSSHKTDTGSNFLSK